ncbi:hypothetical protein WH47_04359, partial [Habropoda laboriosa]
DTLEEFKLVFYGTETSLEFDDELDKDKPLPPVNQEVASQEDDNTAIGARHDNGVDTEGDPWTGSQQVERVSHPEVQGPTTENQTSGCAIVDPGSGRCLGGCLILLLLAYLSTGGASWGNLLTSWQEPPSVRREKCKLNWFHHNGICVYKCPKGTYGILDDTKSVCYACHYSCLTCSGSSDTECTSCHEDAEISSSLNESVCILRELSWMMQSTLWFYRMTALFLINVSVFVLVAIYLAVKWYIRNRSSLMYGYSKVSDSNNGETHKGMDKLQENGCLSDSE